MSETIELDLDELEVAAKAVHRWPLTGARSLAEFRYVDAMTPSVVLELVRRLRAAEALAAARIEQIPVDSKMVAVFSDFRPEHRAEAEEFSEAIKKRCTSGCWTLVAFFPTEASIQALDADQMRAAGWVRAERGDE